MDFAKGKIYFVTLSNSQNQLLVNFLAKKLGREIAIVGPDEEDLAAFESQSLVLLDAEHIDDEFIGRWGFFATGNTNINVALLNLSNEDHAANLLSFFHIQGVFYLQDPIESICKGIAAVLEGELWMSRSLMKRLITTYRRQQTNGFNSICGLTRREIDIVSLLGSGITNMEIANKLFITEHTVKSHLYKIFRKLEVNNRIQAMNWARRNLGTMARLPQTWNA